MAYEDEDEDEGEVRKPKRRVMRVWGLRRRLPDEWSSGMPCLFGTRQGAEENRDPDEELVYVRVEILRTAKAKRGNG